MRTARENSSEINFQKYVILIVDDNPTNLETTSDYLEDYGFQVAVARDGEGALKRARYIQPDIILLDVMMPGLDGFETCQQLKAKEATKDIPVIFMTALARIEDKVKGFEVGAVDYVTKPLQYEEVLARVTTHLHLRELTERLEQKVKERTHELATANQQLKQEVTERKRAEAALKEYSERLEEMVEERTQELQDTQEQLIRQEKLAVLGQLAGGVSHELRNPLGVISNAVYFLQMTLSEANKTTKEYLEIISNRVHEAEKIISDLLGFSRIRSPAREEIAVFELVAEVLERYPPSETVNVTNRINSDLPAVFIDPQQINQVLTNLVTNAYQAMPDEGQLTLSARAEQNQVHISIIDTGHGISKETIPKIFEPLFTTKAKGIGLGLAVSKNLIEVNGGSITIKSVPGQGTTFIVALPVKQANSGANNPPGLG